MRIYYASDIHGSERLWRKFINAADFYEAQVLILGGDLTGKVLVPIVERRRGVWTARVFGKEQKAKGEAKLEELERRIRLNGFYPIRCDPEEYERMRLDDAYRDQVFHQTMCDELRRWLKIAYEKLEGSRLRCYLMPGNDDEWDIDEVLAEAQEPVIACEGRVLEVQGVQMLSSAWANPTPWDSPRELPEDQLFETLSKVAADLEPNVPAIFNLHCPPYDSGLDLAPELTEDLQVVSDGGEPRLVPVGSRAVRRLIEDYQPVLGLHGHIHECRAAVKIGRSLCVNPGSAYAEGVLDGVIVDLAPNGIQGHQLVSG